MADAIAQQQPKKRERKIGSTTYIITSHFQDKGSTAVDKIYSLIDTNTKGNRACRNS